MFQIRIILKAGEISTNRMFILQVLISERSRV